MAAETRTKAERTRQRIVESAAYELAAHGYGGTSLRKVAARAGLHPGSLAFHFATKDDLIAAAMQEAIGYAYQQVSAALMRLPEDADSVDRIRCAVRAHLAALHDNRDRSALVLRVAATLPTSLRVDHAVSERRYGQLWSNVLGDAQSSGALDPTLSVRGIRDVVLGALNATATMMNPTTEHIERVEKTVLALLTDRGATA